MNRKSIVLMGTCLLVASIGLLAGCQATQPAEPPVTAKPVTPPTSTASTKAKSSSVPDMNDYPAPKGVQTGLEGGKKN